MSRERGAAPDYSLVFPVYNPGTEIHAIIPQIHEFIAQNDGDWEAVFVCDGCTDGSAEHLQQFAARDPSRLQVIDYAPNRGKGHAVRTGLLEARGQWRIFTDIDLAYSWHDVALAARLLKEGHAFVSGSRAHPASRMTISSAYQGHFWRRAQQSRVFVTLARLLLPLTQRDPQAGLKGMSAAVAHSVLPRLKCQGFAFDCELLTACQRLKIP